MRENKEQKLRQVSIGRSRVWNAWQVKFLTEHEVEDIDYYPGLGEAFTAAKAWVLNQSQLVRRI